MALQSPIVTISSVTETQERLYTITFNLAVADDEIGYTGINQNFAIQSKIPDYATAVTVDASEISKEMQKAIDNYKSRNAIGKSLAATAATIQSRLVV